MTKCCPSFLLHKESILIVSKNINNILRKAVLNITLAASLSSVAALLHAGGTNVHKHDSKQVECLINNVYFESRGESKKGMLAVAYVTLNRVKDSRFPKTICGVVKQPRQFSWWNGKTPQVKEKDAYMQAERVVEGVLSGKLKDNTNSSTHFHSTRIKPVWASRLSYTTTIGSHCFYKLKK